MAKYIFVTGGVVSSLGKGVTASSLGRLLKNRGFKVFMQKFDPYINVNPGMMDPREHGEVFITDDGAETDLDLGHYERFIDERLSQNSSITTGRIYSNVIRREREGGYGGATVQVIPHITNEIKNTLTAVATESGADIVITEVGGTVGDIESLPYLEAIRQARLDFGFKNTLYIHNTLVPYLQAAGEIKTKPTQHSVKELLSLGIQPDVVVLRTEVAIDEQVKRKISSFCNVGPEAIIEARDVDILYEIPLKLQAQGLDDLVLDHFRLDAPPADMTEWNALLDTIRNLEGGVTVGIVGDYSTLPDAYLSINEALEHAGFAFGKKVELSFIDTAELHENTAEKLAHVDAIVLAYGETDFFTGKLAAIKHARENNLPFLGIDQGMHLAIEEYAKNVANLPELDYLIAHEDRLGLFDIALEKETKIQKIYEGQPIIAERHRHMDGVTRQGSLTLAAAGLKLSAFCKESDLLSAVELAEHPFFIAVQYQPQFTSRPGQPHPLFRAFIEAAVKR